MVDDTTVPVKVNFAEESCQVAQIPWSVRFKSRAAKSEEDFTVCKCREIDVVLTNTILHNYGVEVRQRRYQLF